MELLSITMVFVRQRNSVIVFTVSCVTEVTIRYTEQRADPPSSGLVGSVQHADLPSTGWWVQYSMLTYPLQVGGFSTAC